MSSKNKEHRNAGLGSARDTAKRKRIVFSIDVGPGKSVSVAGNFNDWDPDARPMTDKNNNGIYTCAILLKPGSYEYKFVIDGVWCVDTGNPHFTPNDLGTLNSVLIVE